MSFWGLFWTGLFHFRIGNIDSGREKRRSARYHIDVRVRAKLVSNGVLKILHGRGSDLSQHGMCVFLPTELGMHTTIAIEVTLPYCSQQLKLEAVIRNRRSFAYGIEFINITAAQQNLIEFILPFAGAPTVGLEPRAALHPRAGANSNNSGIALLGVYSPPPGLLNFDSEKRHS